MINTILMSVKGWNDYNLDLSTEQWRWWSACHRRACWAKPSSRTPRSSRSTSASWTQAPWLSLSRPCRIKGMKQIASAKVPRVLWGPFKSFELDFLIKGLLSPLIHPAWVRYRAIKSTYYYYYLLSGLFYCLFRVQENNILTPATLASAAYMN